MPSSLGVRGTTFPMHDEKAPSDDDDDDEVGRSMMDASPTSASRIPEPDMLGAGGISRLLEKGKGRRRRSAGPV